MKLIYRRIGILTAVVFLLGAVIISQMMSEQKKAPAKVSQVEKTIRTIQAFELENASVKPDIAIQGRLGAYDKVDVFAEVSGTLLSTSIRFKEGNRFRNGDILLRIDDEEARLNILSQRSTLLNNLARMMPDLRIDFPESFVAWEDYLEAFDPEQTLKSFPEPQSKRERLFLNAQDLYTQYYSIKSAEARLDKYVIRAPFNGVITQSNVNPGTLIRVGQQVGTLMNTDLYELEASLPVSELKYVGVGDKAIVNSSDIQAQWIGKLSRISDQIDPATQTVKIFIQIRGARLREGMYLTGIIEGRLMEDVHAIPKAIVVDREKVWVFRDSALFNQRVELVRTTKDTAIVSGLEQGMILPSRQLLGVYEGMPVNIDLESSKNQDSSLSNSVAE